MPEEMQKLRDHIYSRALKLSVNLQYSKRYEKAHQQGQYDALKELWDLFGFEHDKEEGRQEQVEYCSQCGAEVIGHHACTIFDNYEEEDHETT